MTTTEKIDIHWDMTIGEKVSFRHMQTFCGSLHGKAISFRDFHQANNEQELYTQVRKILEKIAERYHWFGNNLGDEDDYDEEDQASIYRNTMNLLWDLHLLEDPYEYVSPKNWIEIWELEEQCKALFKNNWQVRSK